MASKVKISHIFCIFAMLYVTPRLTVAKKVDSHLEAFYQACGVQQVQQLITSVDKFGTGLFAEMATTKEYAEKNIVFSPLSIHTSLAMARMGAEGTTASQMDRAFGLPPQDRRTLADNYKAMLAKYEDSNILKMANKLYAMIGFRAQDEFNELLTNQFNSSVDFLNFAHSNAAALTINRWVEERTNNVIQNLVNPDSLDSTTRLVLVNAIHFKGNWVYPFPDYVTREEPFYLDDTRTTRVQMMFNKEYYNYTALPSLDAEAVELPYKDGDLAMLIILPNTRTGLDELERKVKYTPLDEITKQLRPNNFKIGVSLPKFKFAFQAALSEPLSKLGFARIFSEEAEFGKMLLPIERLQVSSVVHKAFIEVNEMGTEAAAATEVDYPDRMGSYVKYFTADRPFHFIIKDSANLVLFKGNFKNNL